MNGPHETEAGGGSYSYGPPLKSWRTLPCYCCGGLKGGRALAAPGVPPEGTMRLCETHAPLAYVDWDEIDRLHALYNVGS